MKIEIRCKDDVPVTTLTAGDVFSNGKEIFITDDESQAISLHDGTNYELDSLVVKVNLGKILNLETERDW